MATWEEICARLETGFQAEALHDGEARKFVLEADGDRTQVVLVYRHVTPLEEWVHISSPIARLADVDLTEIVKVFEQVPFASISLFAGE